MGKILYFDIKRLKQKDEKPCEGIDEIVNDIASSNKGWIKLVEKFEEILEQSDFFATFKRDNVD